MLMLLMAAGVSANGLAQKGMQGIGAKGYMCLGGFKSERGSSTNQNTVGGGLEYQYFLTESIRIKPSMAYFSDDYYSISEFSAALSFDYLIPLSTQFRPYLDLSVRYADLNCKGIDYPYFDTKTDGKGFCFGGGAGFDIRLSYHFSMQVEMVALWGQGKQNNNNSFGRTTIKKPVWLPSVGLTYNF